MRKKRKISGWFLLTAVVFFVIAGCLGYYLLSDKSGETGNVYETATGLSNTETEGAGNDSSEDKSDTKDADNSSFGHFGHTGWTEEDIPEYDGRPYITIKENQPSFTEEELTSQAFEQYSDLDELGRCGTAFANVCPETMPEEERGLIGEIHPSGWQVANYHELIDGNYLYNRCHLIAYSLTGENANEKNLITGTRYLNTEGMQPLELQVLAYVRSTGNHVLYRVTPIFEGENLVATGVEMEGYSVEDRGEGICFHVFAYNVQPWIIIDYRTGDSRLDPDYKEDTTDKDTTGEENNRSLDPQEEISTSESSEEEESYPEGTYILNTNTRKFHRPDCDSVSEIKEKNKEITTGSREDIINDGYEPCGRCKP